MKTFQEAFKEGVRALEANDWPRAAMVYDTMLATWPDDPGALVHLGIAFAEMGYIGAGLAIHCYATALAPKLPDAWANLGASLKRCQKVPEAREALAKCLELKPDHATALGNLAGTYVNAGEPEGGIEHGERAIALDPANPHNANNLGLCYLELGKWVAGWKHYARRRGLPTIRQRTYPGDEWTGKPVRSLVVHGEQGLGDEIMFLGCMEDVRPLVSDRLVIEVNPRLVPIVKRSMPWAEVIGDPAEFTGDADAWIPMGSLPALWRDGRPPKRTGYIKPRADLLLEYRERLSRGSVVLAFKGGTRHTHELLRNPNIADWKPLVDCGDVLSIQYGRNATERAIEIGVPHMEDAAKDLEHQLAAICAAGALVSVQQTALHLAGAAGARAFCVVSAQPAWRYGLDGPMPWYADNVTLLRQAKGEGWLPVIERVAAAVKEMRAC